MSNEIRKLSYCHDCNKNVPHCRKEAEGGLEMLLGLLQVLRIGRWHCLHCQRQRVFLSAVRASATDYQFVEPSEPVDPSKPAIWSRSCSGDSESFAATGSADGGDLTSGHEGLDWVDQFPDPVAEASINGTAFHDVSTNSSIDTLPMQAGFETVGSSDAGHAPQGGEHEQVHQDELLNGRVSVVDQDRTNGEKSLATAVLIEPTTTIHEVEQAQSQQSVSDEAPEIVVAEPVGNFIREKSLVLKSTRIHRFTEKYRDALVDRVLAGKVNISSLTADGMYTEAELVSWIADKAKRQTKKIETLELDTDPRLKDQRDQAGYGPYGGR